jgi:hypothetical protein
MSSNFYKIEKEIHIDEILEKNPYKLVVLIFSFENPTFNKQVLNETFKLKKYIKNKLNNDTDTIYLYINLQKYTIKENKYSQYITKDSLPYVSFYFNYNHMARILNGEEEIFESTLSKLKEHLKDHFKLAKEKENNSNIENTNEHNNENDNTEIKESDQQNLTEQIRQQRKLEEIEKLKQQYLINELTKLKKAKEIQEKLEENK